MSLEVGIVAGLTSIGFFFLVYHTLIKKLYEETPKKEKNFVMEMQIGIFKFLSLMTFLLLSWSVHLMIKINNVVGAWDVMETWTFKFSFVFSILFLLPVVESLWDIAISILLSVEKATNPKSNEDDDE